MQADSGESGPESEEVGLGPADPPPSSPGDEMAADVAEVSLNASVFDFSFLPAEDSSPPARSLCAPAFRASPPPAALLPPVPSAARATRRSKFSAAQPSGNPRARPVGPPLPGLRGAGGRRGRAGRLAHCVPRSRLPVPGASGPRGPGDVPGPTPHPASGAPPDGSRVSKHSSQDTAGYIRKGEKFSVGSSVPTVIPRRWGSSSRGRIRDSIVRGKGLLRAPRRGDGDQPTAPPSASLSEHVLPHQFAGNALEQEGFGGWTAWSERSAGLGDRAVDPLFGVLAGRQEGQARGRARRVAAGPDPRVKGSHGIVGVGNRGGTEVCFLPDPDDDELPGTSSHEAWREREFPGALSRPVHSGALSSGSDGSRRKLAKEQRSRVDAGAERKSVRGQQECVWVVGHSFIHWAANRAQHRPYGLNLELDERSWKIVWLSHRGMKWDNLLSMVEQSASQLELPKIVLIHLGGNDVGAGSCKDLIVKIKKDFGTLMNAMPDTHWGWSDIIVRFKFLQSHLWCRGVKKLNTQVACETIKVCCGIRHFDVTEALCCGDPYPEDCIVSFKCCSVLDPACVGALCVADFDG
ncbi:uncharacterized protein LOC115088594 [Rhinatrema bivittatum]|uniref:uncharacterized protein LOC115088594 n=1 Tax=Rhinatrema bivittatum TaxID=194408 RepID=UPI00112816FC|nr:uncharacterized protein LOC115088594 [Rhinatrema bivittatum]